MILYPEIDPAEQFRISAFAALSARSAVSALCDAEVSIKWPNDIYIGSNKVGGILIKNAIAGPRIQHSVVGIGINVNEGAFPPDISNPVAIMQESDSTITVHDVRERLIVSMNDHFESSMRSDFAYVRKAYESHLYMMSEDARFEKVADASPFSGIIEGVDTFGRLRVKHDGSTQSYTMNEISFLK